MCIMVVGTLRVRLLLREARTLKDKRQVVRSIQDKLRNSFQVAIAEVDELDQPRLVVLGLALVGAEVYPVRTALEKVVAALRAHPVAELLEQELEVQRQP